MTSDRPKLLKARQRHTIFFVVGLVLLLLVSQPWMTAGAFPRECMLWLGYALTLFGSFGRAYCSIFIGGRKNDIIVRSGPFAMVRNPLYVFSFIAMVGVGLESGTVTFLVLLVGAFAWYYPKVVAKEEAFLAHKFGEDYVSYTREVPRWVPNLKKWNEPEEVLTMPSRIRKTMMDTAVFLLPLPCLALLNALHAFHTLPVWLTLP